MKKVLDFDKFNELSENVFDENLEIQLNEDQDWYIKNGYKIHDKFTTIKELVDYLEKDIKSTFITFSKRLGVPVMSNASIEKSRNRNYITASSEKMKSEKDLGIFVNCMHSAQASLFSGRELNAVEMDGKLLYKPTIWSTVNIMYESLGGGSDGLGAGGSNGLSWRFSDQGNGHLGSIIYSIDEHKIYTQNEWESKEEKK